MDKLKAVAEKTGLKQFVVKTPENLSLIHISFVLCKIICGL